MNVEPNSNADQEVLRQLAELRERSEPRELRVSDMTRSIIQLRRTRQARRRWTATALGSLAFVSLLAWQYSGGSPGNSTDAVTTVGHSPLIGASDDMILAPREIDEDLDPIVTQLAIEDLLRRLETIEAVIAKRRQDAHQDVFLLCRARASFDLPIIDTDID